MDKECRREINRGNRHVHHQQDDRSGDEVPQMLKITQQLKFTV